MCLICMHSPCLSGCPNASEPMPAKHCSSCGKSIFPGDEYADIDGNPLCEECLADLPLCILIPKMGGEWKTVQEGETIRCSDCKCCELNDPLQVGEEYGVIDGSIFCEPCIDELPFCELVARCGQEWKTASEDDIPDGYDG